MVKLNFSFFLEGGERLFEAEHLLTLPTYTE